MKTDMMTSLVNSPRSIAASRATADMDAMRSCSSADGSVSSGTIWFLPRHEASLAAAGGAVSATDDGVTRGPASRTCAFLERAGELFGLEPRHEA